MSPRLPRDLSGLELARETGSHLRLTTTRGGEHHVTIPAHAALRVGTLSAVLDAVARHHELSREQLLQQLFGS